ncbi:MAG: DUF5672 family protein [Candidatus Buchananbacteria bacterium]
MKKKKLKTVTLLGIDCVDVKRLALAMEICQKDFEFAAVKILTSLKISKLDNIVKIKPINSAQAYSHFIIWELDKYVDTPHVLIVQYDGFILNSKAWTDKFLKYDYIGAPWLVADWSVKNFDFPVNSLGKSVVGNGGFSLRSKKIISLTARLAQAGKFKKYHPEDVAIGIYYRKLLEAKGIKFAPVNLAKQFSFEAEDKTHFSWNRQFGFHGLKWTDISKWSKKHPEYKIDNPALIKKNRLKF